jgi:hypothetical protein
MLPERWLEHRFYPSYSAFYSEYAELLFAIYNDLFKDYHSTITVNDFIYFAYINSK